MAQIEKPPAAGTAEGLETLTSLKHADFATSDDAGATVFDKARAYLRNGLSLVAIKADGSKQSALPQWKQYQDHQPTEEELCVWFNGEPRGVAIVAGRVSGNLECVDIDAPELTEGYFALIEECVPGLLSRLVIVETPRGGRHMIYRCTVTQGNQKLALRPSAKDPKKIDTLIETRGEGGYFLAPGSPASCHANGREYQLIQGSFDSIHLITVEERDVILDCARSFNQYIKPAQEKRVQGLNKQLMPGQDFDLRGDVQALLERHGWRQFGFCSAGERWIRPDSNRPSATFFPESRRLYVFSTNAVPLEYETSYSPFALLTIFEHGGDFKKAAKALAKQGFGINGHSKAIGGAQNDEVDEGGTITCPYKANGIGLVWMKPSYAQDGGGAGHIPVQLTNFIAEIKSDVSRDDGAEQVRAFEIRARMAGETEWRSGTVSAADFGSLPKWVHEVLGAKAVVFPGKGEHTKVAIQLLSHEIQTHRVIAHTGWRNDNDQWLYYHSGGAIGADGLIEAEVELPGSLSPVSFTQPPTGQQLHKAIRAIAFNLSKVAPYSIMLPLIGAGWAAVLTEPDFSIMLVGYTGSGKSELAALVQAFFGAGFNAKNLPAAWTSSANSLEATAHAAKDCVLTIDDFCPLGSATDQSRLHAAADRVLRAQGNHSGRGRCRADGTLRPPKPPRGMIVSTGEDLPRGQSLRARTAIIPVEIGSLNFDCLTLCQRQAQSGLFAEGMAAFLKWLATENRIGILRSGARENIGQLREEWLAAGKDAHKRIATTLAQLQRAWQVWLEFAAETGALSDEEILELRKAVKRSLIELGQSQGGHQTSENPSTRFIELLQAALSSGKAYLGDIDDECFEDDDKADGDSSFGLAPPSKRGELIGWKQQNDVYLQPDLAYRCAQSFGMNGEGLTVTSNTLWKRLREAGILASCDNERHTIKKQIGKYRKRVLHLKAKTLFG